MKLSFENYLQKHPFRKVFSNSEEGKFLLTLMEERLQAPQNNYWEWFGYEIGGPICYGYVKWIICEIEQNHPEILDIAFVARDGWLLQKVFNILPHRANLKGHYIYAPRIVGAQCRNKDAHLSYQHYIAACGFENSKLGIVDTITMLFSSQRLVASSIPQDTHGFYWVVLENPAANKNEFNYSSFQSEHYHLIRCWNLMEFIMTSPEPPICAMRGSQPVYQNTTPFEDYRSTIFEQIEAGVLKFVRNICRSGEFPQFSNQFITKWINDFLKHPCQEDIKAFDGIMFSELADHSDSKLLDPFGSQNGLFKLYKDRFWAFSQKHQHMYNFLHTGNALLKKAKERIEKRGSLKFDGGNTWKFAEFLAQYDIISFDIFDTLIFREVDEPDDLFYLLEEKNGISDFHSKRILAEKDARHNLGKKNGEINIFDIYRKLSQTEPIDANEKAREELQLEASVCYENPVMSELYHILREKGCRLIAVSDMYIPESHLRKILNGVGYLEFEYVFVSCDCGVGKGNGALQRFVQSKMGEDVRIIHIGDNYSSDVHGSKMAGWDAVWYCKRQYLRG